MPYMKTLLSGQIDFGVLLSSRVPYSSDSRGTYRAGAAIVHQVCYMQNPGWIVLPHASLREQV